MQFNMMSIVTTFAVVWIEMFYRTWESPHITSVTTFAVVWIEIGLMNAINNIEMSPPSRWCGLK